MTDPLHHFRPVTELVFVALLVICAGSAALVPMNSLDFWWHLKSGEIILSTGALPEGDPLSYTSAAFDEQARYAGILRGYWLAQMLYAGVIRLFGEPGIFVLRLVLYELLALAGYAAARARGASLGAMLLAPPLLLAWQTTLEDSDRPQQLTFLGAALTLWVLWSARAHPRRLYLLPPLFLVACNCHAGFLVMVVFLWSWVVGEWLDPTGHATAPRATAVAAVASLATLLNPQGWAVVRDLASVTNWAASSSSAPMEWRSPLAVLPQAWVAPSWKALVLLWALCIPAVALLAWRRQWGAVILTLGAAAASLKSMRYIGFFLPVAAVVLPETASALLRRARAARMPVLVTTASALLLVTAVVVGVRHPNRLGLRERYHPMIFPVAAADFLAANPLPGPVFNDSGWGGYLSYRLWPQVRTFLDSRQLSLRATEQHYQINSWSAEGQALFRQWQINTVVTPAIEPYQAVMVPLVGALSDDPAWSLVYRDGQALVFCRACAGLRALPKTEVYREVLAELDYWIPIYGGAGGAATYLQARAALAAQR